MRYHNGLRLGAPIDQFGAKYLGTRAEGHHYYDIKPSDKFAEFFDEAFYSSKTKS